MGGLFGVVSKQDCVSDLFFGTDYHSHLGTRRGGLAVYNNGGFQRAIHNIENSPFRTKFESDVMEMKGYYGIGCISDSEPQPLVIRSHLGAFALTTVGRINNKAELVEKAFKNANIHFMEMSGGNINTTELVGAIINQKKTIKEGIEYVHELVDGSVSLLVLTCDGMYAARDKLGRTPIVLGAKDGAYCACFESFSYINLGYRTLRELGAGEIVFITPDKIDVLKAPSDEMKVCAFLWSYYGYPTATYEGVNIEQMRYRCGALLASTDNVQADCVAGVPDSGTAHAIGYASESGIPFARPIIKYTPTWPRSFMPKDQNMRSMVAKMKLIPVESQIRDKKLIFIDDSIVRGTQLCETAEFLYKTGAKEVHIRPACPPLLFGCKYLNFARSTSELDLITRRIIMEREGRADDEVTMQYINHEGEKYDGMVENIRRKLNFTTLKYNTLDNMIQAIGLPKEKICTYCWNGK